MSEISLEKAARRGEPSYVWRAGQERRLRMILQAAEDRVSGSVLVDGCGVGSYLARLAPHANKAVGIDIDFERCQESRQKTPLVVCAAGEALPFAAKQFDLILSHEVLEHVQDDHLAVDEMARLLRTGGRVIVFVPNRGYPFETHGVYWRGRYHFGNIPLVNYLPDAWRSRLAPHVRAYTRADLMRLFYRHPFKWLRQTVIFGAYDNIIQRLPRFGKALRWVLQLLEKTPLRALGLSHFWVGEKVAPASTHDRRKS
ncbi:MAG: class I SAM-dependent methyltransferase [Anaerolineae bacterium]|nr:class I SAM-dependent methyltransferase [Anaerolineae bacterium]